MLFVYSGQPVLGITCHALLRLLYLSHVLFVTVTVSAFLRHDFFSVAY